ncbi:MAG: butyrate kinase [Oscillospiraceae bacterium]|jgi:butyrate kinase
MEQNERAREGRLILVINTGSTSSKLAVFREREQLVKKTVQHKKEQLEGLKVLDQLPFRVECCYDFIRDAGFKPEDFDCIVCRGGQLGHISGGIYKVTRYMMDVLRYGTHSQHASSLSCFIGYEIGQKRGIPVIINDSPMTDELDDVARILGLPEIEAIPGSHMLNGRYVARKVAREKLGRPYEQCRFIIAHLGGGITLGAHVMGRAVDVIGSDYGPMSPERAGRLPSRQLIDLCYSGKYTHEEMKKRVMGKGGIYAYLGTQDMYEVEQRVLAGDEKAKMVCQAMAYGTAKGIGELSTVCFGKVDRIIITGGLARFNMLVDWIKERVGFIAPIELCPGEFEMEALDDAAVRFLDGEEAAKEYDHVPYGYESREQFYESISGR